MMPMSKEKTIKIMGYFDKEVEKTKEEYVKIWIENASLSRLCICDGGKAFDITYEKVNFLKDEIKKLAEFNWDYMYKEQHG
jgi:hypothetical protein